MVDVTNANFPGDYASIGLSNQIVFHVVDSAKFVEHTSPAGIVKSLNLYASYIALRIITSVKDARVKFSGRDSLDNVSEALNGYLSEDGIGTGIGMGLSRGIVKKILVQADVAGGDGSPE